MRTFMTRTVAPISFMDDGNTNGADFRPKPIVDSIDVEPIEPAQAELPSEPAVDSTEGQDTEAEESTEPAEVDVTAMPATNESPEPAAPAEPVAESAETDKKPMAASVLPAD